MMRHKLSFSRGEVRTCSSGRFGILFFLISSYQEAKISIYQPLLSGITFLTSSGICDGEKYFIISQN